jgi:hypothetical protein
MKVKFYGGIANGKTIDLPATLLRVYRWPLNFVPSYMTDMPRRPTPRINDFEEYYLIPGDGYYTRNHVTFRRYMEACQMFTYEWHLAHRVINENSP